MSLLGEAFISHCDWFRGKNGYTNMENVPIFGGIFCVLPLVLTSVDTENMAATEIQQHRSKMSDFLKFMADFQAKKANKIRPEDTFI